MILFFLTSIFYFLPSFLCLSAPASTPAPATTVTSYAQLLSAIRQTRAASTARIEQAVDQEKVREAWEIGKLIDEHVLQHKRAGYGQQVLARLAKDLGMSKTELEFMLQFARTYPITPPAGQLSWSHYRELLSLNDNDERQEVAEQATREHWGRDRVREEVKRRKAKSNVDEQPITGTKLTANPGKPYTYRVIKATTGPWKDQKVLDLGFSNYHRPSKIDKFQVGDMVVLEKKKLKKVKGASVEALFTFKVHIFHVLDGDTVTAVIDLGFDFMTVQTLRLRGLDAPEIESSDGKESKVFLEKLIGGKSVIIKTLKSDKYDRYLADLFADGEYVNQKLVEERLAVRVHE